MSTWKAVYVDQDTPTETEGWYVIGFADSISPVVLKVEANAGTTTSYERRAPSEEA